MSSNFLSLNPSKLSFFLLVFLNNSQNKVILSFICLIVSLCHLFILFVSYESSMIVISLFLNNDSNLTFSQQISAVSKSYFYRSCDLGCIRNTVDPTAACTIATSLIHSELDYCNSLLLNLPSIQN
jgi:hypothetical protein